MIRRLPLRHPAGAHSPTRGARSLALALLLLLVALLPTVTVLAPVAFGQESTLSGDTPLGQGQILIVGMELRPAPASQVVPRNTGTIISPLLVRADQAPGQPAGERPKLPDDAVFLGELRGPAFQTPVTLSAPANGTFAIPPLPLDGLYTLSDIRLVSGGQVILVGVPNTVQIEVIEKVIVSQVTARPLTAQEIKDRGIVVDQDNFQVVDFTIGLGLQDEKVKITFPVLLPAKKESGYPGVRLPMPQGAGGPATPPEQLLPNLRLAFNSPNVELSGFSLEVPEPEEGKSRGLVSPLPGVVIIPGNIAYLNQFFSVLLKVSNVSPAYSNLTVRNLQAEIKLPPGVDGVLGTSDDPLRMASLGTPPAPQPKLQPVVQLGPDGSLGTDDDIPAIAPQTSGDGEFLVEGRREGIHQVTIVMTGTLEGLPGGPVVIKGSAAGVVEVRNPQFSLTFHHPSVITAGEEYDFDVTVTNISETPANFVSMSLLPRSLSGATLLSDQVQQIETIAANDSATVRYRLRALKTGAVVATSLNSDGIPGRFDLKMAVGELGIPMSPNTLVLPPTADFLPASLRDVAIGLLGQAYALATSPFPPKGLLPLGRDMVLERATDFAAAGQRRQLLEPLPDMGRDLLLDVLGNNYSRIGEATASPAQAGLMRRDYQGFDTLLRKSRRGDALMAELAALMLPAVQQQGILGWQQGFAEAAASRPAFFQAVTGSDGSSAPVVLNVTDASANKLGMTEAGGSILRAIPWGNFLNFAGAQPNYSQMAIIAMPDPSRHVVEVVGTGAGQFDLGLVAPEGNRLRRVSFENVAIGEGGRGRVAFLMGSANTWVLELDADGNGSYESAIQPTASELVVDRGPVPVSAVQVFIPTPRSHPSKYGVLLSVLFSEEISKLSSQEGLELDKGQKVTNFAVDANDLRGTKLQPRGRVVYMYLRDGVGPFVDRTLTVSNIDDRLGNAMAPISATLPIRMVLNGPAGTMEGTVRRADGTPVPNARIWYEGKELDFNDEPYWVMVSAKEADADGHYSFDYIIQTGAKFTFIDPETGERGVVGALPRYNGDRLHVDFVLRGRGALTGRVFLQNGAPADKAVVTVRSLYGEPDEQGYQIVADESGAYLIGGIPVGPISIFATHGKSRSQLQLASEIPSPGATIVQTLTVLPIDQPQQFGSVQGQVFRADGVTPAAGIPVYTSLGGMVTTDATGSYRVDGLYPAPVLIRALDEARLEQADVNTTIVASRTVTANLLLFGGTGTVRGVVLDAENHPVEGAVIYGGFDRVLSAADGSFVLPNMPIRSLQITAVDEEAGLLQSAGVQLTRPGEEVTVQIILPVQGVITGRVFKADGKTPVPNLKLFVLGPRNDVGFTDANGAYRFEKLPRGEYTISAFYPDFSDGNVTLSKIVFKDEVRIANVVFRGRGTVTGTVYDDDGVTPLGARVGLTESLPKIGKLRPAENPLCLGAIEEGGVKIELPKCENVVVEWEVKGRSRRINNEVSSGTFTFRNVFVGDFLVEAANAFSPATVSAPGEITKDGQTVPVTLTLYSTSIVTGVVYDIDGTTPLTAGIVVELDAPYIRDVRVATDAQGRFEFPLTSATGFELTAIDGDRELTGFANGSVAPGQDASVPVRLLRKGDVTVLVSGAGGPVSGAQVTLSEGARTAGRRSGVTGPDGRLLFTGGDAINEGRFSVTAVLGGVRGSASGELKSVQLDPTGHVTVSITLLNDVGSLQGRFLRGDGVTPIPNAQIRLQGSNGELFASTDAAGAYRFDGVALGSVSLTGSDPVSGRRGKATGQIVTNGQLLALDMIQIAQGTVTGIVRRSSDGAPIANASVALSLGSPFGGQLHVTTNLAGEYTIPAVPAGTFSIRATAPFAGGYSGYTSGSLALEGEIRAADITVQVPLVGRVVGTVTNRNGSPAIGATVRAASGGTTSVDNTGAYTIENVRLGEVILFVDAALGADGATAKTNLAFDGDVARVDFQLSGTATVAGQVLTAAGQPAAFTQVSVLRTQGYPGFNKTTSTDITGAFSFGNVPVDRLQFTARQTTQQLGATLIVTLTEPGATTPVTITLEPAGTIQGRILNEDGTPADKAALELTGPASVQRFGSTASDGTFSMADLKLGSYTLKVSDPLGAGIASVTTLLASQGQVVDLGDIRMDEAPPAVVVITPTNGTLYVPVGEILRVRFSEPVDPATINATNSANGNLVVNRGALIVPGTWALSENNTLASFTPASPYPDFATVSLRVKKAIKDRAGRTLAADVVSAFTTTDATPPSITSRSPLSNAAGIELNAVVRIAWAEAIDPVRFNAAPLRLLRNGQPVAGTASLILNNTVAIFAPASQLLANSVYSVVIPPQQDSFGNSTGITETYPFRSLDLLPPVIVTVTAPSGTVVRVGTNALVVAEIEPGDEIAQVEFLVDGQVRGVDTTAPYEYLLPVTAGGTTTTVKARATDKAGNQSQEKSIVLTVQPDLAPSVTLKSSAAGNIISSGGKVTITVSASDDLALKALFYQAKGAATGSATTPAPANTRSYTATYVLNVPVTASPNSTITVEAKASDSLDQFSPLQTLVLTIADATIPTVRYLSPTSGTRVDPGSVVQVVVEGKDNGAVAAFQMSSTGPASIQAMTYIQPPRQPVTASLPVTIPANAIAGQLITLNVRSIDVLGNQSLAATLLLRVKDVVPPTAALGVQNGITETLPGSLLKFTANASDGVGVSRVTLDASGAWAAQQNQNYNPAQGSVAPQFTVTLPQTLTQGSVVTFTATARDEQGNSTASAPVAIRIVADARPQVTVSAPLSVETSSTLTVSVALTDDVGVRRVVLNATGGLVASPAITLTPPVTQGVQSFVLNVPANAGGKIFLRATATDTRGQITQSTPFTVTVTDLTRPTVSVSNISWDQYVYPGLNYVDVYGSDNAAVASLGIRLTGAITMTAQRVFTPATTPVFNRFTYSIPVTVASYSRITVTVTATDAVGNVNLPYVTRVQLRDIRNPVTELLVRTGLAHVQQGETFTATVRGTDDVDVESLWLSARGALTADRSASIWEYTQAAERTWSLTVPSGAQPGSVITLTASSRDSAYNTSNSLPVTLTVTPAQKRIVGTVTDADGSAAGIPITVTAPNGVFTTTVDANGLYTVTGVAPGTITVRALSEDGRKGSGWASLFESEMELPIDIFIPFRPGVAITTPLSGTTVVEGQQVSVHISATSEIVGIESVEVFANGESARTFYAEEQTFAFSYTVPLSITQVTLAAVARDFETNESTSAPVNLVVVADAGTTVEGRIVDEGGAPVAGASVKLSGFGFDTLSTVSSGQGLFSFAGVPTAGGTLQLAVRKVQNNLPLQAFLDFTPVVGGITNVGDVTVRLLKVWDGGGDGLNWSDPANWNANTLPAPSDDVYIPVTATVQVMWNSPDVNSLHSDGLLTLAAGANLTLNEDSVVSRLAFNAGVLTSPSMITVTQNLTWTGGELYGTGRTVLLGETLFSGNGTLWMAGHTLENRGHLVWALASDFQIWSGARIVNAAGATLSFEPSGWERGVSWYGGYAPLPVFENSGTLLFQGSWPTRFDIPLNNSGTLDLRSNLLRLYRGGTNGGTLRSLPGTSLEINSGYTLGGNLEISGTLYTSGGTLRLEPAAAQFAPGSLLRASGGTVHLVTDLALPSLLLDGATITGTTALTTTTHFTWTSGTMAGTGRTVSLGQMSLSSSGGWWLDTRTLENRGTALWQMSTDFQIYRGARLINAPGATWTLEPVGWERSIAWYSDIQPQPVFENYGLLRTVGAFNTNVRARFENDAQAEVNGSLLRLSLGGSNRGALAVAPGSMLDLSSNYTLSGTLALSGTVQNTTGTLTWRPDQASFGPNALLRQTGGTVTTVKDELIPQLWVSSGTFTGTHTITVTQALTWTGGNLYGTGRTVSLGRLSMSGANSWWLAQRTLENRGTGLLTMTTAELYAHQGARIVNAAGATLEIDVPGTFSRQLTYYNNQQPRPTLENNGLLIKRGTGKLESLFTYAGAGPVDIQAGTLWLNGGGAAGGAMTVNGGALLELSPLTLPPASSIGGAGDVRFRGSGTTTVESSYAIEGMTNALAGTVIFPPGSVPTLGRLLRVDGGTVQINSVLATVLPELSLSSGELGGSSPITVTQAMTWTGGTLSGASSTATLNRLVLGGTNILYLNGRTLDNRGTATWRMATDLYHYNGARILNAPGAVFDIEVLGTTERKLYFYNNQIPRGVFENRGTLVKRGGGPLTFQTVVNAIGATDVQSGTLKLESGGTLTGSVNIGTGALVEYAGTHILSQDSSLTGAGSARFNGTVSANGSYNVSGQTTVAGGTLAFAAGTQPSFGGLLRIQGGTMTIDSAQGVAVGRMELAGGTLAGSATLTATQNLTWTNGTMQGPGRTVILNRMATSAANILFLNGRALENRGLTTMSLGANFYVQAGARIINQPGAIYEVEVNGTTEREFYFNNQQPRGSFENYGSFVKKGSGPLSLQTTVSFAGATEVLSGTLKLKESGATTGTIAVQAGALMDFTGAHTLAAASSVGGAGSVRFGGAVSLNGAYAIGGTSTVAAGTLTVAGTAQPQFNGLLRLEGGTLNLSNAQGLAVARVIMSSGTLAGTAPLTVTEALTWTNGTMQGPGRTTTLGSLAMPNTAIQHLNGRVLENRGTGVMRLASNLYIYNGGGLVNAAGASLDIETAGTGERQIYFNNTGTRGTFVNDGALVKRGAIGLEVGATLNNNGSIVVQEGGFEILGGGTQSTAGSVQLRGGTLLDYTSAATVNGSMLVSGTVQLSSGGVVTWQPALADFRPGSLLRIGGGTSLSVQTPLALPALWQSAATITGTAPITVTGHMTWTGGIQAGAGRTVLLNTAALGTGGSPVKQLDRRTLDMRGSVVWTAANLNTYNGAQLVVQPGAIFELRGASTRMVWSSSNGTRPTLQNFGTILRTVDNTDLQIDAATVNSGTIHIQSGGLNFQAPFTQGSAGTTVVRIDGATALTQLHRLNVGGTNNVASLGGTLQIERNPAFDPALNTTLAVVTYGSRIGQFAQIGGLQPFNGKVFTPSYGSTALNLLVSADPGGNGSGGNGSGGNGPGTSDPGTGDPVVTDPGAQQPDSAAPAERISTPPMGIWGANPLFLPLISGGTGGSGAQPAPHAEGYILRYVGQTQADAGQPLALRARLRDARTAQPLAGRTLLFTVAGRTLEAVTNGEGIAEALVSLDGAQLRYDVGVALRPEAAAAEARAAEALATTSAAVYIGGLDPAATALSLKPGVSALRTLTGTVTSPPAPMDLVFSFDATASMAASLPALKAVVEDTLLALKASNVDVRAAIVSHHDYVGDYTNWFGYSATYGMPGMSPYLLHVPLTDSLPAIQIAMSQIVTRTGGDPETDYTRVLYESVAELMGQANPQSGPLGYRAEAKRALVLFGDDVPHDDNLSAGIPGQSAPWSTGGDPGRDAAQQTADDLDLQTVLSQMQANGVTLLAYHLTPFLADFWSHWAAETGGARVEDYDQLQALLQSVLEKAPSAPLVRLLPQPGYESWVALNPAQYVGVPVPSKLPFQVQVTPPAVTPPGLYTFTLSLVLTPAAGDSVTLASHTVSVQVGGTVDMVLRKSDNGRARVMANDVITYTLAFTNAGNVTARGVTLRETVPANAIFRAAGSSPGWSCPNGSAAGTQCVLAVGDVAAKSTATRSFVVQLASPLAEAVATITNTAVISDSGAEGPEPSPANNTAADTTSVNRAPKAQNDALTVAFGSGAVPANVLANDSDADPGEKAALILTAVTQPAHGVAAIDGSKKQILYTPAAGYAGPDSLTYTVSDGRATATAALAITVTGVDLVVQKSDGGRSRAQAGEIVTWTVRYTNTGSVAATGVTLRETVPSGSSFDSAASSAGWSCAAGAPAGTECTLAVGLLAPQAADAQTFAVKVGGPVPDALRALTNTVVIAASGAQGPDQTPANNTATDNTSLNHAPAAADDTVAVVNGSANAQLAVRSNDSDPDGDALVIVSVTPAVHGTISTDGAHLIYTPAVGFTGTDSVVYTISDGLATDTAAVTIEVTGSPLALSVTANPPAGMQVTPLQQVVYTLVVRNGSAAPFTALEVAATIPAETVFQSATQGCAAGVPQPDATRKLVWNAGELAAGASCSVQFTVAVSETALGSEIAAEVQARVAELPAAVTETAQHPLLASTVDLSSFTVHRSGSDVQVLWTTRAEQELEGFVIWKQAQGGPRVQVNATSVPSKGQPASYDFTDSGVPWTVLHQYWLEVRYNDGRTVTVGPRDALITQYMAMVFGGQAEEVPAR